MIENKKFKIDQSTKKILIALIIYLIVMLVIFLPPYLKRKYEKLYIVTTNYKIKYENGKWQKITQKTDYDLQKFDIYENDVYKGNYKLVFSNKAILLDDNDTIVNYNGYIFAHRGTLKLNINTVNTINELSENDRFIINNALSSLDIDTSLNVNYVQKISMDVDKDNNEEQIYAISNYYAEDNANTRFSIIFMYKNNSVYVIDKVITDNQGIEDNYMLSIKYLFDIRADKKMELLYSKAYPLDPSSECEVLYKLSGKKKVIHNFCE